jgi:hypothetical protein
VVYLKQSISKKNIIIGIWSITFCISKHVYPAIIPIFCLSKKPAKRIFPSIGAIPHFLFSKNYPCYLQQLNYFFKLPKGKPLFLEIEKGKKYVLYILLYVLYI